MVSPLILAATVRFRGSTFKKKKTLFGGFNEFPFLVCWCTVIHHHRSQGPTLFRRVRWEFTCVQCDLCTDTGPPVLRPIREDKVLYIKSLTQGDWSRINTGSGNRKNRNFKRLKMITKSNTLTTEENECMEKKSWHALWLMTSRRVVFGLGLSIPLSVIWLDLTWYKSWST